MGSDFEIGGDACGFVAWQVMNDDSPCPATNAHALPRGATVMILLNLPRLGHRKIASYWTFCGSRLGLVGRHQAVATVGAPRGRRDGVVDWASE